MSFDLHVENVLGEVIVRDTLTINSGKELIKLGEFLDELNNVLALKMCEAKVLGRRCLYKLGRKYLTKFSSHTGAELIERFGIIK